MKIIIINFVCGVTDLLIRKMYFVKDIVNFLIGSILKKMIVTIDKNKFIKHTY